MKKIKQYLIKVPVVLLGVAFLVLGLAKVADLTTFHTELGNLSFLPYFIQGLLVLFIPGFQMVLGMIVITRKDMLAKTATFLSFLFFLTALSFSIYFALHPAKGCGGCGKLDQSTFDWKLWKPVGIYLIFLCLSVIALFLHKNHSECDSANNGKR